MGMDVIGKNAKNKRGEYFRNNVWWWRPLWNYCLTVHGDIAGAVENGHSNNGEGLDADKAHALGMRLRKDIEDGFTAKYEAEYREYLLSLPQTECQLCKGTGIRRDPVGVENGMPTRELDEEDSILLKRSHGWCNGCSGQGKKDAWDTNYPFSVENVQEFSEFLLNSGGFAIC